MPREITLSIVQTSADDDVAGNIARMAAHLDTAGRRRSDVVVLPEVWTGTGFSRDGRAAEIAEPLPGGPAVTMLQEKAREHGMHVIGSLYERGEGGRIHNTAPVIGPSGEILARYRKTHLFDAEGRPDLPSVLDESRKVAAGDALVVAETNLCRMGVAICSDLRFPEVFRELALRGAELVVLPTAFLAPRLDHWEFLLRARATDNQVFVAASGMVGRERHSGIGFVGRSMVVDPWGVIRACAADEEGVLTTVVDLDAVPRVRGWWDLLGQRRPALYERQREEHAG